MGGVGQSNLPLEPYIVDALLPDLVGHDQRPASFAVYLSLWRMTLAIAQPQVRISHQRLARATGLSRSTVQAALDHLVRRQLIHSSRSTPTSVPIHTVLRPWARRGAGGDS